jgi:putative endonuclease
MLGFLRKLFASEESSGNRGERLAAEWLERERGFSIVARNWRSPKDRRDEIDLVGRDGEVLVFVEVKTRVAGALVPGYHAVDERKKRALRRAIEVYLAQLAEKPNTFRFDVVEVALPAEHVKAATSHGGEGARPAAAEPEILHFENVPLFSKYFRG